MRVTATRDLAAVRQTVKDRISVAAEMVRKRYITAGEGKAMMYLRKADEARKALADNDPTPAEYPLLAAEVGITAPTLRAVAMVIAAQERAWITVAALIEAAEQRAKRAVDAAPADISAIDAAAEIDWDTVLGSIAAALGEGELS